MWAPESAGIGVGREVCRDFARASHLEWLETNGTGGYAMGTVAGVNTRRYHGHLVAAIRPPTERALLLAKLDETVLLPSGDAALATNQWPGALDPNGWTRLTAFRSAPMPTWSFEAGGVSITRSLFLVAGEQAVVVIWRASAPCRLRVLPFVAFRDHHALGAAPTFDVAGTAPVTVAAEGWPTLALYHDGAFVPGGDWYRGFEHLEELDRGLDFREDLWKVGALELDIGPDAPAWVVGTIEPAAWDRRRVLAVLEGELDRRRPRGLDRLRDRLEAAADQFLVRRADGTPTVIAGYPWFTDWGRDTMIALPGLCVARGRLDEARAILRGFLGHLDQGLIPNRFPDRGTEPEYNTVDATLWLFQAARAYLEGGGDRDFLAHELYPRGREIIAWHRRGTHHGIAVDPSDGLLVAGGPGTQLTWMDARVGDRVVTPRHGKPVEVNALWYNALRLMAEWGLALGDAGARDFDAEAERVAAAFARRFWNPQRGCLFDVLLPEGPDDRVRPNQLFALALPYPLLSPEQRRSVLNVVERELVTDVGLRTLARGEPGYVGRAGGNVAERDGAYHQGTVWPWLLGPYVRAYLRVEGRTPEALAHCRMLLRGLEPHLEEACLGTLGETFDGDAPHRPAGAPAQAWSVAEVLALLLGELR
jgi:predicted glycogen debranching enzyme